MLRVLTIGESSVSKPILAQWSGARPFLYLESEENALDWMLVALTT